MKEKLAEKTSVITVKIRATIDGMSKSAWTVLDWSCVPKSKVELELAGRMN
jgi:hypothetical protein